MKILKIEDGKGLFHDPASEEWKAIDEIDKHAILNLLNRFVEEDLELDEFDEELLQNKAHLIIYKSIHEKFSALASNKDKFKDESDRKYLEAFKKYQ